MPRARAQLRGRKDVRLGPLVIHTASQGFLGWRIMSVGIEAGPLTWNLTNRQGTADIPGPWSLRTGGRRRGAGPCRTQQESPLQRRRARGGLFG